MSAQGRGREPAVGPARPARGRRGAVASPHHLATWAGLSVLADGGSAVDAAIATNAALSVVSGHSCGLGGDAFWIIWDPAAGRAVTLNGSGRSAAAASLEEARGRGWAALPVRGPWSVTVPGAIDSWGEAHGRFGRLPWPALMEPAIDLAEGFPAAAGWCEAIERAAQALGTGGDWARTFRPEGRPWRPGEVVRLPALARTLRLIAAEGPEVAYRGSLAQRTAEYLEASGSPLRLADLDAHVSDWAEPLAVDYRGVTCLAHPPNSVGVIALQGLEVLETWRAPAADAFDGRGCADAEWVHLGLEVARLGLAERDANVTDPGRMAADAVEGMLSPERIGRLAGLVDPMRARSDSAPAVGGGGTVHLAAADAEGGLVSLMESNYLGFGSGLVDPETGIAFQDRGAFFSLQPGHVNRLAPRSRTVHTLTPGMLLRDGRPWIAHGSMGGEIQPQVFMQFVSSMVDGGLDIATAVAAPRWAALVEGHLGPPSITALESRYHEGVVEALRGRGHEVSLLGPWDPLMGHANAVEVVRDEASGGAVSFAAACDPRSDGLPGAL